MHVPGQQMPTVYMGCPPVHAKLVRSNIRFRRTMWQKNKIPHKCVITQLTHWACMILTPHSCKYRCLTSKDMFPGPKL